MRRYKRCLSLLLMLSLLLTTSVTVFAEETAGKVENGGNHLVDGVIGGLAGAAAAAGEDAKNSAENAGSSDSDSSNSSSSGGPPFQHSSDAEKWVKEQEQQQQQNQDGGEMEKDAASGTGSAATNDSVYDGSSFSKTGYLIYGSDSSGRANTPVVFVSSYGNMPAAKSGSAYVEKLITRFDDQVTKYIYEPVVFGFAPFSNSGNGMGAAIGNWLKSDYQNGQTGADWVLMNYFGMPEDKAAEYVTKENYINVEAVMWAGLYSGTSYQGITYCSTAKGWAEAIDSRNYLGRYTHQNLPNSLVYDKSWLSLAIPSDTSSRHESPEITAPVGLGIVSVRVKPGDKEIIKVYRTKGVVDQTTYGSCDKHVTIKDEGSYKVKKWHVSK